MSILILAQNKRASYDYQLIEKIEAGIVLKGTEVKSLRAKKVSISEAHIVIDRQGEVWAHNITIGHYDFGNVNNHEETRKRKLLLNKKEIIKMQHQVKAGGMTIVPTKIYFKEGKVKIEIALAKGKKNYDKRQDQAKKDAEKKLRRGSYD